MSAEMSSQKILLTTYKERLMVCHMENDRPIRIHFSGQDKFPLGTIVIAKIKKIVPGINAAFVSLGDKDQFFMSLPTNQDNSVMLVNRPYDGTLKCDDEIVVQVSKQAIKQKQAVVDCHITLSGHFCVLQTGANGFHISAKLDRKEKERLQILSKLAPDCADLIIRTNAKGTELCLIEEEIKKLSNDLQSLFQFYKSRTCYSILRNAEPDYLKIVKDIPLENLSEIVTDRPDIYKELQNIFSNHNTANESTALSQPIVRLYDDVEYPMVKLYSLETRLQELTSSKVWLKSGGFLVIEQGETLTAIDVNSGKNEKKNDLIPSINLEAAKEICYQIKARNISGMILIDFINMKDNEALSTLIDYMKKLLKQDYVKANYIDMTGLGLMEITREKRFSSLKEQI